MMKRLGGWISNVDNIFASISLILIISVTVVGVFMRFVMGEPLKSTEEVSLALFVWFTFLGASVVTKEDGHVGIDYFVAKLNSSLQKVAFLFREAILLILNIFVFIYLGAQLTTQAATKLTPVLRVSYIYIDIAVVLSGLFSVIHIVTRIVRIWNKDKRHLMAQEDESELRHTPQKEAKA